MHQANNLEDRYLLQKWSDRILQYQAKERLRGRIYPSSLTLARRFETETQLQAQQRRNQALRASGQKSEAQRAERDSIRLLGPGDGEDVCEDQRVREAAEKFYDNWAQSNAALVDEWGRYARFSAEIVAKIGVAQRHQEVRTPPHGGSKHGRQTRRSVPTKR